MARFCRLTARLSVTFFAPILGVPAGANAPEFTADPANPYRQVENWADAIVLQHLGSGWDAEKPECRVAGDKTILFAPGVSEEFKRKVIERASAAGPDYQIQARWTATSRGSAGAFGNPATISYSFVPDGVLVPNSGLGSGSNNLNSVFDGQFGSRALWRAKFAESFQRWDVLSGMTYVEDPDDSAPLHNSQGLAGVRGDVRISGFGYNTGILAYAFYPNFGDIVMNTAQGGWGAQSGNNWRLLRNTVMHETGHTFGLAHVDPTNSTKLMEAFLNTNFDGPQDDDIQGGQRLYGDPRENNDNNGTYTDLGTVTNGLTLFDLSTDDDFDYDWYRMIVPAGKVLTITASPVGSTYLQGPEGGTTTQRNSRAINDLRIRAFQQDGVTLLGEANGTGAGFSELLTGVVPPFDNIVHVQIDDAPPLVNDIQRHTMAFNLSPLTEGYFPRAFSVFRGDRQSGSLGSLTTSDDNRLAVKVGVTLSSDEAPIQVIVESTARTNTAGVLKFDLEAAASFDTLQQRIELFNYNTNSWETVDVRNASATDTLVEVTISTDAARFVQAGTNEMKVKMSWKAVGPVFSYPWFAYIDFVHWTITYQ